MKMNFDSLSNLLKIKININYLNVTNLKKFIIINYNYKKAIIFFNNFYIILFFIMKTKKAN